MRYVQLRAFHHVAICGGFSRAAEALNLTQPAISDQVGKLEQEYDVLLFDRRKKQVVTTQSGERLLEITRRLFDAEQQAVELLSESRSLNSGLLRIVADSPHHMMHILAAFREKYPGVRIKVTAGNTETVMGSLYSYEADIGVLGEVPQNRDFESLLLNSTPIIAFVAANHPLANARKLRFSDLARHPMVLRENGSKTRKKLEEAAELAGVHLNAAIEAEGREAVRELVASGAGVGFVSQAEFGRDGRFAQITIDGGVAMNMDEALVCLRERKSGKLIQAFFDVAHKLVKA